MDSARQKRFRFPYWDYHLEICCIPRKQDTLYIKIKTGKEKNCMLKNQKEDLFDVLAAYDCQREEILEKLQKEDWETSYSNMVSVADRAADALSDEAGKKNAVFEKEALLAVTFYQNGKLKPEVKEATSVLAEQKIVPKINWKPEDTAGEKIRFVLTLEEFIVTSQEIGTKVIKMLPKYRIKIGEKSVEGAVKQVWNTLRLSEETLQAEIEVNFCFDVTDNQIGLQMRMPVTLSLGGESMEEHVNHIDTWMTERGYKPDDGQLEFNVNVYDSMKKKIFEAVLEN